MASYLRPRRGQKTTAETQAIVLKKGEVFFEIGNSGTPTTGANAKAFGKIKMGDGTSTYSNLGYFIDVDTTAVDWTDSTGTATSAAQGADNYGLLNAITPTATIKSIFGSMKQLLFGLSTQVTSLNNDLSTINTQLSGRVIASVTADGVITSGQMLDRLYSQISTLSRDDLKRTVVEMFGNDDEITPYYFFMKSISEIRYTYATVTTSSFISYALVLRASGSERNLAEAKNGGSMGVASSPATVVPQAGFVCRIVMY